MHIGEEVSCDSLSLLPEFAQTDPTVGHPTECGDIEWGDEPLYDPSSGRLPVNEYERWREQEWGED